jgi:hypothetical protein
MTVRLVTAVCRECMKKKVSRGSNYDGRKYVKKIARVQFAPPRLSICGYCHGRGIKQGNGTLNVLSVRLRHD